MGTARRWKAVRAGAGVFLFKRWPWAAQPGVRAWPPKGTTAAGAQRNPIARDGGGQWFAGLATRSPPPMRPNKYIKTKYLKVKF